MVQRPLHLAPQLGTRIFRIQLRQFAKEFLSFLVPGHRDDHLNLDDLIAAFVFSGRRGYAFFSQTELLPALRSASVTRRPALTSMPKNHFERVETEIERVGTDFQWVETRIERVETRIE